MVKLDLRTVTMDIPPQDVITRDNVSVKVNAVLYFGSSTPIWRCGKSKIIFSPPRSSPR